MNEHDRRRKWLAYLAERKGTYEYRTLRYAAVYDRLLALGLQPGDLIVDVGAGMCDFDRYIRTTRNFDGRYWPIDGAIDGVDLNVWYPRISADFFVSIETLEHLRDPGRIMFMLNQFARKGCVITTPCADKVDVFSMDNTHISPLNWKFFAEHGWEFDHVSVFPHLGIKGETILAWKAKH